MPIELERLGHHHGATGSPRRHGALACLGCAVERPISDADHEVVIARVLEARSAGRDRGPLLFCRGEHASLERS